MAKQQGGMVLNLIAWITGVIVSLAVGFGLINKTLEVPYIGIVNVWVGWIVVITTLISAVMALIKK